MPSAAQTFPSTLPSPQQIAWQDRAFGVIVHFGTNTFLDREWGDGTADPAVFAPDTVDAAQWAAAAKSAGATYMVLVAKHHDGFALWPTGQSTYSVAHSPWLGGQGDLVKQASAAASAEGMGFGVYLSPWDRHEPRYADSAAYDTFYAAQLGELVQGYGPLVEWWLDGAGSAGHVYDFKRYVEQLRTFQPNTMVFADVALFDYGDIRWVGNEEGVITGENWNVIDRHGDLRWRPVEVDTPLHGGFWFFHDTPAYRAALKSIDALVDNWERSVGRGGQLMLGIAPDRHGLLPAADVDRLQAFGAALRQRYGPAANLAAVSVTRATSATSARSATSATSASPVRPATSLPPHRTPRPPGPEAAADAADAADAEAAEAAEAAADAHAATDNDPDTFWSSPDATHGMLEIDLGRQVTFDRALLMERLDDGQHVRRYALQAWIDGAWQTLAAAEAIGHMKLEQFAPVTARRVRLNVLSSVGTARIREVQLFRVSTPGR